MEPLTRRISFYLPVDSVRIELTIDGVGKPTHTHTHTHTHTLEMGPGTLLRGK